MMIVVMITITLAFFSKWLSELMLIRPTSGVGWWMHPRDIYICSARGWSRGDYGFKPATTRR